MAPLPLSTIFLRALTAVAQAGAMAGIGIFFSRIGILDSNSRKVLAAISMKVTVPCLLFSSIITCPQGGPTQDPSLCPELLHVMRSAWPMLIFPFIWVSVGVICGFVAVKISCAPRELQRTIMAAVAFGNSTGLPIVLLTAIAQAGVLDTTLQPSVQTRNFLLLLSIYQITYPMLQWGVGSRLLSSTSTVESSEATQTRDVEAMQDTLVGDCEASAAYPTWWARLKELLEAALVPPVIAVLIGLFIGAVPALRGVLVNTHDFNNDSVLEWFFNAIEAFGKAAVPLNMLVLGGSLANIPSFSSVHWPHFKRSTIAAVIAKLVLYPAATFGLVRSMHHAGILHAMLPNNDFHLQSLIVACLVSATPTANNLSVMAELKGGATCKHALAYIIFLQYCLAPFFLTAWIVAFVSLGQHA